MQPYLTQGTSVTTINPEIGPSSIEGMYDELLSMQPTIELVIKHEDEYDAFVIACYSDHMAIHAAREITNKPVLGIAEASMYTACMLGDRFSIVTTSERWEPLLRDAVRKYGLHDRCASVLSTRLAVLDLEGDHEDNKTQFMIEQVARQAIERDGAEVICLGCAGMTGMDKLLESKLGVPVLDGVVCAVKFLEAFGGYGLKTSKKRLYSPLDKKMIVGLPPTFSIPYEMVSKTVGVKQPEQ